MHRPQPAVLQQDVEPFFHFTCTEYLADIMTQSLKTKPPHTTGGTARATLGGLYLAGEKANLAEIPCFLELDCTTMTVLAVRVRKGTRFCLDEDEVEYDLQSGDLDIGLPEEEIKHRLIGLENDDPVQRNWMDNLTCVLAQRLRPNALKDHSIRVFGPPMILTVSRPFDDSSEVEDALSKGYFRHWREWTSRRQTRALAIQAAMGKIWADQARRGPLRYGTRQ